MSTNEKQLVRIIQQAVSREYPDAWQFKVVGHPYQESGVPDLLLCVEGTLVGLEVKHQRPGESIEHALARASALQLQHVARIRTAGGLAAVVCSVDAAMKVVRAAALRRG